MLLKMGSLLQIQTVVNAEPAAMMFLLGVGDTSYGEIYAGSTDGGSSEKRFHKPQLLLEDSNLSSQTLQLASGNIRNLSGKKKPQSEHIWTKISLSTETKGIEFDKILLCTEADTLNPLL